MKNIKKKNIYIPIEIYFREFHQRLYLINKAIKKNFRVYIGTKHGIDKVLRKKIKTKSLGGIYFYKGNIIRDKNYLKKIYRCCDNFVALDEEMSPAVPNRDLSLSIRGVFDERISKFFVVGKTWKSKILKHDKRFKNIVVNSGWPKYDLIKDNDFNLYYEEALRIKKKFGKFYLFSSNFGTLSEEGLTKMKKKLRENHSNAFWLEKEKIFKQSLKDFKEFIYNLNNYYLNKGKKKIIIRPHPSEFNHEDWIKNTKDISDKIFVIYKNDIIPWIIASEGLIHRGCGTSIDALLLKKKSYYWAPHRKLEKYEKNLTYKISKVIRNFEEIDEKNYKTKFDINDVKNEVENFKKKNSSIKIIEEINKLKTKKEYPIRADNKVTLFFQFLKKLLKLLFVKNKNQKIPYDIKVGVVKNFYKNLKNFSDIKIRRINNEALEIDIIK